MNNYTELIDQYLNNELSPEERLDFENELKTNDYLKKEFEVQKNIMEGLKRAGIKHEFSQAIRQHILMKGIAKIAGIVLAVSAVAVLVYFIASGKTNKDTAGPGILSPTELIAGEKFEVDTKRDTVIETKGGIVFTIPASAFRTDAESVELVVKEALNPMDIMKAGLSTTSDGKLLETAGMFYINAYKDGKELELVKNIDASVPADSIDPGMMLFDGKIDKDGNINWVNPVKIEKNLRIYDITTLDFYPEKYRPTLQALDLKYEDKMYTDSLYYSFSGYGEDYNELVPDWKVGFELTDDPTDDPLTLRVFFNNRTRKVTKIRTEAEKLYKYMLDSLNKSWSSRVYTTESIGLEIDPSRIKAIWNEKFNNTFLATKEFEERLKFIHTTCNPNLLSFYVNNLNKAMYVIDSMCANISEGPRRSKFLEFASRKDGGVKVSNHLQAKLSKYFADKYEVYKKAAEKTWLQHKEELNKLNTAANEKRRTQSAAEITRESKVLYEEYCLNVIDAYRQIGEKKECPMRTPPPSKNYYNVVIPTTGWKNLDQYVMDATINRESLDYVTEDGRKASITYSGITVQVEGIENYDRVLAYLIPDSLSSFQRMNRTGNTFTEKLNSLLKYDLVVLAYKGNQAYSAKKSSVEATTHTLSLNTIEEKELENMLKVYGKSKRNDLVSEAVYQAFEQKENLRQIKLQKENDQRRQIAKAIFPCFISVSPPTEVRGSPVLK